MKKNKLLLGVLIFPYIIVLLLISIYTGSSFLIDMNINIISLLVIIVTLYIASLACVIAKLCINLVKKREAREILRTNMIIKLVHIPAYLIIFVIGLISMVTIFTFGISIVLVLIDCMTIILSGLVGVGGVIRSVKENKMTKGKGILLGILQFIFCVDIIAAIKAYNSLKA